MISISSTHLLRTYFGRPPQSRNLAGTLRRTRYTNPVFDTTTPPPSLSSRHGVYYFSTTNKTTPTTNETQSTCDIIQGPALLRTSLSRLNRPQPSLLFLPGLRSLPFWSQLDPQSNTTRIAYNDPSITKVVQLLEEHYKDIANEYNNVALQFPSDYEADTEHTKLHNGQWDWHSFMLKGIHQEHFIQHYPITSSIIQYIQQMNMLFENVPFGYTFFSTLHPNSSIQPHTAPMNLRVRIHLPLIVPIPSTEVDDFKNNNANNDSANKPGCGIRVGSITRTWQEGKALVLDDSFEHEVWNYHPTQKRVLLLVDIWHPDVTVQERADIVGMFQHARDQGWLSSN